MNPQQSALLNKCLAALAQAVTASALLVSAAAASATDTQDIEAGRARALLGGGASQLPSIVASDKRQAAQLGADAERDAPARSARPPAPATNQFEHYVRVVTGTSVNVFGRSFFRNVPSTFAPNGNAAVNADYTIGAGDELQIRAWGMVDMDVTATVDRNGTISIPRVGVVKVAGLRYRDLQGHLTSAVGRIFNNFELTVNVSQVRSVQVYVVGHAVRPGTYTVNAMSTLLNALLTSGGPSSTGSLRRIQLKRGGETVASFDLYDVLLAGDKTKDVSLRDGDVIYIPEMGPLAALTGNVKQPGIFELKDNASVAQALRWAGGLDSSTEGKAVIVEKNRDNAYATLAELPAGTPATALDALPLGAGDIVRVFSPASVPVQIRASREFVRVSGEVKQSGMVELRKGETLRELIARLGGTTEHGYVFATRLLRDSVRISQQDRLDEAARRFEDEIEAVAAQRTAATSDADAVARIAAEVERQRQMARKMRDVRAEGRIVLEMADSRAQVKDLPDVVLQDGDAVLVPRMPSTVDVLGAVVQQNAIMYRKNRTVNDYLDRAGGLTENADKSEMYVIRADGSAQSVRSAGWLSGLGATIVNPGDAIIVPNQVNRGSLAQSLREWTSIFYQFGLGAAGLKVLKD